MNQDFTPFECFQALVTMGLRFLGICVVGLYLFLFYYLLRKSARRIKRGYWLASRYVLANAGEVMPVAVLLLCMVGFVLVINWLDSMGLNWTNNTYRY